MHMDYDPNILSRKRRGQPGSATIGSLLTREPDAVPIVLSVKDLVSTHLAIIASTAVESMPPYKNIA